MAFGKDGRKCLGIELVLAEILLATAALLRKFDMNMNLWIMDERDVAFVHDYQAAHPNIDWEGVGVTVDGWM